MSIERVVRCIVRCDVCSTTSELHATHSGFEARWDAIAHGWRRAHGQDLCPNCWGE